MNLETRIAKLEQLTGAHREGVYCDCPVITRGIGVSDFYAKHEPCGKPINQEDVGNEGVFESRALYPFYETRDYMADAEYVGIMAARYDERTRPPIKGRRLFIHDFSGQDPDAAAQAEAKAAGRVIADEHR